MRFAMTRVRYFTWSSARFRKHPGNRLGDPLGIGAALAAGPQRQRFVAVAKHAAVLRLVRVDLWVGIDIAELLAEQLDIIGLPGQEQPTRADAVRSGVVVEVRRSIVFRGDGDRVDEQ